MAFGYHARFCDVLSGLHPSPPPEAIGFQAADGHRYRTLEGSATSTGTGNTYDYVSREGVLTFAAGERAAQLEVTTVKDER